MRKFELYLDENHSQMIDDPEFTIRGALRHVANLVYDYEVSDKWANIRDQNGNVIGAYRFKEI